MGVGDAMNIRNGGLPINVISVAAYRILNAKDVTFELGFIFRPIVGKTRKWDCMGSICIHFTP